MKNKNKVVLIILFLSVFIILSFGKQKAEWHGKIEGKEEELNFILKKCAEYCEKVKNSALYYVCQEKIKEEIIIKQEIRIGTNRTPAVKEINSYIYDYQLIRKGDKFEENRILIEENGEKKSIKDASMKTKRFFSERPIYGPVGFLSQDSQMQYNYKFLKEDEIGEKKAYVIEAVPNTKMKEKPNYGKLWVDQENFSILKIEIAQDSLVGFEEVMRKIQELLKSRNRARRYKVTPIFKIVHHYGVVKNGIRFPSKTIFEESYMMYSRKYMRSDMYHRSSVTIKYYDYRFFIVDTKVKYNCETALRRGKYEKGFIVTFSFTRGAHEEVARVKGKGLEIKLIEVEDLLLGKIKI